MKILMTGGGTLGPVTALLAVAEELRRGYEVRWIGTYRGPEARLISGAGYAFSAIVSAKFRRYVSARTLLDPLLFGVGFFQALVAVVWWRPEVIVSAGGYVSVPVVVAGWLLQIPSVIHQQDVLPGLANRLMAPFARVVTVAVPEAAAAFDPRKTVVIGNPVRRAIEEIREREDEFRRQGRSRFGFSGGKPVVLIVGGGTGAAALNRAALLILDELLVRSDVLQLTGRRVNDAPPRDHDGYVRRELLTDDMPLAYATADVVVCRAGMGTVSELLVLGKTAVVVPIPGTHQEANAEFFVQHGGAVAVSESGPDFPQRLLHAVKHTLDARDSQAAFRAVVAESFGASARRELAKIVLSVHNGDTVRVSR